MARDKKKKSQAADRRRPIKKKTSILSTESIDWVDYKDVNLLRRFMSERAKIRARRVTGNSAQQQRAVARAIRIAARWPSCPTASGRSRSGVAAGAATGATGTAATAPIAAIAAIATACRRRPPA